MIVASRQDELDEVAGTRAGVTDWLLWPFKETYARTKMHSWVLRQACRWSPAPLPPNEKQRLLALQNMQVLDTPAEERFDRYTRIAAELFDVPIALVSLVDRERQWFKSRHGLEPTETPRETAFCAHAILAPAALQVPDALQDPRFADNPLVTGPPRVRFYAGAPLAAADGSLVGTLCLPLEGRMLLISNYDRPGVIGFIGNTLGSHQVNIADMHLSRIRSKGTAICLVTVDNPVPPAALHALRSFKNIIQVAIIEV